MDRQRNRDMRPFVCLSERLSVWMYLRVFWVRERRMCGWWGLGTSLTWGAYENIGPRPGTNLYLSYVSSGDWQSNTRDAHLLPFKKNKVGSWFYSVAVASSGGSPGQATLCESAGTFVAEISPKLALPWKEVDNLWNVQFRVKFSFKGIRKTCLQSEIYSRLESVIYYLLKLALPSSLSSPLGLLSCFGPFLPKNKSQTMWKLKINNTANTRMEMHCTIEISLVITCQGPVRHLGAKRCCCGFTEPPGLDSFWGWPSCKTF